MTHRLVRAPLPLLILAYCVTGCGLESPDGETRASRTVHVDRDDLSLRCETALDDREAAAIRNMESRLPEEGGGEATVLFGAQGPPLGSVDGAAWSERDSSLYVLDGLTKRVQVYGLDGRPRDTFGGQGGGPGEFEEVGEGAYFNRLAVQPSGHIAVRGHDRVHLFRGPDDFLRRVEPKTMPALLPAFNVAAFEDSAFLYAVTRAFDISGDYETRTRLDLRVIRPGTPGSRQHAHMYNELIRLPRFNSASYPDSPWTTKYDRLWDAQRPGLIAIASLERHGVCFFNTSLDLVGAQRVQAPVVEVDAERKDRVIEAREEEYGPEAPMIGEPWDEFYDYWPPDLPRYTDIVLRSDSVAWMRRPIPETRWYATPIRDRSPPYAVDVIHARLGYQGTFESRRFPVAFMGDCPLVVETRVPGNAAQMDTAFHGLAAYCPDS